MDYIRTIIYLLLIVTAVFIACLLFKMVVGNHSLQSNKTNLINQTQTNSISQSSKDDNKDISKDDSNFTNFVDINNSVKSVPVYPFGNRADSNPNIMSNVLADGNQNVIGVTGSAGVTSSAAVTGSAEKTYDEYDDKALLNAKDEDFIKLIDNVIVDGNNLIYKIHEYKGGRQLTTEEYFNLLEVAVKKLYDELPGKAILIVLKDPENDTQLENTKTYLNCKNIKTGYKLYFTKLLKHYPSVRIIMAYGDAKPRDDFAALWLSDQLGEKTILLSRDRYSDARKTNQNVENIKFIAYGKNAIKYNKLLNKPFAHVGNSSRVNLVGYSFSKKHNTAFYQKAVNRKSIASDYVLIINMK